MLAKSDYESMKETLYLLSNSKNAKKLDEAIRQDFNSEYEDVDLDS